tara:strand:- start:104 stop:220 length:117 start_codon:yes stop_codon:yes gene_type:complete
MADIHAQYVKKIIDIAQGQRKSDALSGPSWMISCDVLN